VTTHQLIISQPLSTPQLLKDSSSCIALDESEVVTEVELSVLRRCELCVVSDCIVGGCWVVGLVTSASSLSIIDVFQLPQTLHVLHLHQ
jgi:hypothetical protein